MSDNKARLTVTVDPQNAAYANKLFETGKAPSVSAVVNDALAERRMRERRARRWWNTKAAEADPNRVSRIRAHVDEQLRAFEERHTA
ncbi:hypothetical protein GCM10023194_81070 [Planotetraspora phitsanulokensis]|uniref:Uncharacterized protein n=1 Tax=Planotetraspora phitsanulokensis TaxID=575192 RepID=A0A8J3UQM5_9ACTN|nr:hypothetical protein [Planotetraspora phitsanulokensis]GII42870.1 hypothetical protein Pph01_78730 [Planotetraspora phitsanulokensis]